MKVNFFLFFPATWPHSNQSESCGWLQGLWIVITQKTPLAGGFFRSQVCIAFLNPLNNPMNEYSYCNPQFICESIMKKKSQKQVKNRVIITILSFPSICPVGMDWKILREITRKSWLPSLLSALRSRSCLNSEDEWLLGLVEHMSWRNDQHSLKWWQNGPSLNQEVLRTGQVWESFINDRHPIYELFI
jgi:hypothetical protein